MFRKGKVIEIFSVCVNVNVYAILKAEFILSNYKEVNYTLHFVRCFHLKNQNKFLKK